MADEKQPWSELETVIDELRRRTGILKNEEQDYKDAVIKFIEYNDYDLLDVPWRPGFGPIITLRKFIQEMGLAPLKTEEKNGKLPGGRQLIKSAYEAGFSVTKIRQPKGAKTPQPVNKPPEQAPKTSKPPVNNTPEPPKTNKPPVTNNTPPVPVKPSPVVVTNTPEPTTNSGEYGWPEKFNNRPQNKGTVVTQRKQEIKKFLEVNASDVLSMEKTIPFEDGTSITLTIGGILDSGIYYQTAKDWDPSVEEAIVKWIKYYYVKYKEDAETSEAKGVLERTQDRLAEEPIAWTTLDDLFKSVKMTAPTLSTSLATRKEAVRKFLEKNDPLMLQKKVKYANKEPTVSDLLSPVQYQTISLSANGMAYEILRDMYTDRLDKYLKGDKTRGDGDQEPALPPTTTPKNNTNDQPVESDSDDSLAKEGPPPQLPAEKEKTWTETFTELKDKTTGAVSYLLGKTEALEASNAAMAQGLKTSSPETAAQVEAMAEKTRVDSENKSRQIEEQKRLLEAKQSELTENRQELQEKEKQIRSERERASKKLNAEEDMFAEVQAELARLLEDATKSKTELEITREKLESAVKGNEKIANTLRESKRNQVELQKELDRIKEELRIANDSQETYKKEIGDLKSELTEEQERTLKKLGGTGSEIEKLVTLTTQLQQTNEKNKTLSAEISRLKEQNESLKTEAVKQKIETESRDNLLAQAKEICEALEKDRNEKNKELEETKRNLGAVNEQVNIESSNFNEAARKLAAKEDEFNSAKRENEALLRTNEELRKKADDATDERLAVEKSAEVLRDELRLEKETNRWRTEPKTGPIDVEKVVDNAHKLGELETKPEIIAKARQYDALREWGQNLLVYELVGSERPSFKSRFGRDEKEEYVLVKKASFETIKRHWAHYRLLEIEHDRKMHNFYKLIEEHKRGWANETESSFNTHGQFLYMVLSREYLDGLTNGGSKIPTTTTPRYTAHATSFSATSRALTLTDHVQQLQLSALPLAAPGSERVTVTFSDSDGNPMLGFVASGLPVQYVEGRGALLVIDMATNWANLAYTYATHMGRTIIDSRGTMVVEHGDLKDTYFLDIQAPAVTALEYAYGQESLVTVASADDTRVSLLVSYVTAALSSLKRLMIPVHSNALPAAAKSVAPRPVVEEEGEEEIDTEKEKQLVDDDETVFSLPPTEKEVEEQRKREEEERLYEENRKAAEERERRISGEGSTSDASSTSPLKTHASIDTYQGVDMDDEALFDEFLEWK